MRSGKQEVGFTWEFGTIVASLALERNSRTIVDFSTKPEIVQIDGDWREAVKKSFPWTGFSLSKEKSAILQASRFRRHIRAILHRHDRR